MKNGRCHWSVRIGKPCFLKAAKGVRIVRKRVESCGERGMADSIEEELVAISAFHDLQRRLRSSRSPASCTNKGQHKVA